MGAADSVEGFTRWYTRLLRAVVHIDVKTDEFNLFHNAMQSVYRLAMAHSADSPRGVNDFGSRSARPASSMLHDRVKRSCAIRQICSNKLPKRKSSGPPRVELSLSQSSTVSSRSSFPSASQPSLVVSQGAQHLSDTGSVESLGIRMAPPQSDDECEPLISNARVSTFDQSNRVFDSKLREAIWLLAEEFSETSTLLRGFHDAKLNRERIAALTLEAVMQRRKSPASTRGVIRNVSGLITFSLANREDSSGVALTGEGSVVLLHDYLESVADRGRTVPGAVKTSLSTWSESLGISWPLETPLVCAAAQVESNETPKHAPPMKLDTVKKLEELAVNVEVAPFKRAFAAGILLMTYTSLRFSDVQRLRTLAVNEDSIHGTLLQSKTKKPHGLPWPRACPRTGVTGATTWVEPLLDFHRAHEKLNGTPPSFVFPCLNHRWELEKAGAAAYSSTRRKLALVCAGLGDPEGETYTLHSPKNFLPAAATQMNFETREINVIGHWSSNSRMHERYDRSVCANELLLRNTIIQKMVGGWCMVDSFMLHETVPGSERIGRDPVVQSINTSTQLSAETETAPAEGALISLSTDTPMCETCVIEGTQTEEVANPF